MSTDPQLYKRTVADVTRAIEEELSNLRWRGQSNGGGGAMAQLFGRLTEVMTNRLNQSPEQHFRAFLNEAGIDRLVPRAAGTELTFTPADDGPAVIQVPKGTQVTAPPTDTRPEIIYETERLLNVIPTRLDHCIVVDQLNYSDRSAAVRGEVQAPFRAFQGTEERERILYVGHDELFTFADDTQRENARVVLKFCFASPDATHDTAASEQITQTTAADGETDLTETGTTETGTTGEGTTPKPQKVDWCIEWHYWDGEAWQRLPSTTEIEDGTKHFHQSGLVKFTNLPPLQRSTLQGQETMWLGAKLTRGTKRTDLPVVKEIAIYQEVTIPPPEKCCDEARLPVSAEVVVFERSDKKEHRYYLGHDTLFSDPDPIRRRRAIYTLEFTFAPAGSPPSGDNIQLEWLYWGEDKQAGEKCGRAKPDAENMRWIPLTERGATVDDMTQRFSKNGKVKITGLPQIPVAKFPELPPSYRTQRNVSEQQSAWLAVRLTSTEPGTRPPVIQSVRIQREIPAEAAPIDAALSAIQAGALTVPLDQTAPFMPLGPLPVPLDSFYLRIDDAFTKPGAMVTLHFRLKGLPDALEDTTNLDQIKVVWEYASEAEAGWTELGTCVRGCPTLEAYEYDRVPGLPKPTVATTPFRRRKVLEFSLPPDFDRSTLPEPMQRAPTVKDIYTGNQVIQIPIPPSCSDLPEEILINGCYTTTRLNFRDKTCAFTAAGDAVVQFTVPVADSVDPHFVPMAINGQIGYWVRARVLAGSYDVPQKPQRRLLTGGLIGEAPYQPPIPYPPVIEALSADYSAYRKTSRVVPLSHCVSKTDARWQDHRAALRMAESFAPYRASVTAATPDQTAVDYEQPALYLGFNPLDPEAGRSAFPANQWIELRIEVADEAVSQKNRLRWEYWNGITWRRLPADDKTYGLARSEYMGFTAPPNHLPNNEFGFSAYWLRLCAESNGQTAEPTSENRSAPSMPLLNTIALNTIPAINAETITEELLGSSSGQPNQSVTLAFTPVLADVEIEVREPDQRTTSESEALSNDEPATPTQSLVQVPTTRSDGSHEGWVLWHGVSSFHDCGPADRCYIVDQQSGQIRFGDGRRGRIPPPGIDNIRAKRYRTHHGDSGNLPAHTLTELRNPSGALNEIQAVTNPAITSGGFAVEALVRAKVRGPHTLKNRARAVTAEDYQWLALEIEGVEQAYGIPTRDANGKQTTGWVTVIVIPKPSNALPENVERKLVPTPALLRIVKQHLEAHVLSNLQRDEWQQSSWATLVETDTASSAKTTSDTKNKNKSKSQKREATDDDTDQIHVTGPSYIGVRVIATVIPKAQDQADAVRLAVLKQLDAFLHPVHGGPERKGWQPGRAVYLSEVAAEIEQADGVDYVSTLHVIGESLLQQSFLLTREKCLDAMPAGSHVTSFDEQMKLVLTNPLSTAKSTARADGQTEWAMVIHGFKQGDAVAVVAIGDVPVAGGLLVDQVIAVTKTTKPFKDKEGNCYTLPPLNDFRVTFAQPIRQPDEWPQAASALRTGDNRIRLPIVACHVGFTDQKAIYCSGVTVRAFNETDQISLIHPIYPYQRADFLTIRPQVLPDTHQNGSQIFVPAGHLVFSGEHEITIGMAGQPYQ